MADVVAHPTREEYLNAITVGERRPHNDTIYLAPYDSAWSSRFLALATLIRNALAEKVLLLEHVGSTSVPGLAAKPVIDMVLAVSDSCDEAAYVSPLERQGFVLTIREPDWFGHRLLRTPEFEGNLHVFSTGCPEIDRMVAFRDQLRASNGDRRLYEETKRELAERTWKHIQDYADAKTQIVSRILAGEGAHEI
jgi:GrpB-like predicted nucleotidyltransferase (UPF0157 family)